MDEDKSLVDSAAKKAACEKLHWNSMKKGSLWIAALQTTAELAD